jgi:predicted nucleic acid-binding protein
VGTKRPNCKRPVRAPAVHDLLIAAAAELSDLVVLHLDKDFELIANVTGQPVERLALSA